MPGAAWSVSCSVTTSTRPTDWAEACASAMAWPTRFGAAKGVGVGVGLGVGVGVGLGVGSGVGDGRRRRGRRRGRCRTHGDDVVDAAVAWHGGASGGRRPGHQAGRDVGVEVLGAGAGHEAGGIERGRDIGVGGAAQVGHHDVGGELGDDHVDAVAVMHVGVGDRILGEDDARGGLVGLLLGHHQHEADGLGGGLRIGDGLAHEVRRGEGRRGGRGWGWASG